MKGRTEEEEKKKETNNYYKSESLSLWFEYVCQTT